MSYLFFMDESGHDHKTLPYEVRGGIALHADRVWPFALKMRELELQTFGLHLHDFGSELKGNTLLDKDRFKWAGQTDPKRNDMPYPFTPDQRRDLAKTFIERTKTKNGTPPGRLHFTAYGQACLYFVDNMFHVLREQEAKLFAVVTPCDADRTNLPLNPEHLRKDLVFLFERYFYFLEEENETGLIVMDQTELTNDRRFSQRIEGYSLKTQDGRRRAERIVPIPLFVTQDMSYAMQAADICIYAINNGYRLPERGMVKPVRDEIEAACAEKLKLLQW